MLITKEKNHVIEALEEKQFFKLVCGASFTDTKIIENLSFIFTLAGAHVIDLAPSADVIFAARRGINKAIDLSPISYPLPPVLMASIQLDKDPHFRKIKVDHDLCDVCGACVKVCPTEAFVIARSTEGATKQSYDGMRLLRSPRSVGRPGRTSPQAGGAGRDFVPPRNDKLLYSIERCYGCDICPSYCHVNALELIETNLTPKETLKEMIDLGINAIEFHFGKNYKRIQTMWNEIKDLVKNIRLISFSIGSDLLTDEEIKNAANLCYKLVGGNIILQCDGTPMSGGNMKSGNNTDDSCLHVAKVIQEEKLQVYLQISGGTNVHSFKRALDASLNINGIAIGSYARKLLMPYLNDLNNKDNLNKAVNIAKSLVQSVDR